MAVINVKVKNLRPEYNNLKEWSQNSNNIYIGRKGIVFVNGERYPKKDSIWANPFKINSENSREKVLKKYKKYIWEKITEENLVADLLKLKGKNLGCWCAPEKCHGDILIEILENKTINFVENFIMFIPEYDNLSKFEQKFIGKYLEKISYMCSDLKELCNDIKQAEKERKNSIYEKETQEELLKRIKNMDEWEIYENDSICPMNILDYAGLCEFFQDSCWYGRHHNRITDDCIYNLKGTDYYLCDVCINDSNFHKFYDEKYRIFQKS